MLNGFNLGRYWEIGPQKTLYVLKSLLKAEKNELIIFESEGLKGEPIIELKIVLWTIANKKISDGEWGQSVDVKDLINLTYGLENVLVISAVKNDEEVGQFVIENNINPDVVAVPFESRYLLNKADIGRLHREIEGGVFVDDKYVETGDYKESEV